MADRHTFRLTGEETAELRRVVGPKARVLTVARGPDAVVVLLVDRMAVRTGQGWHLVAWSDIQRGGWDSEQQRLHWQLVDGTRHEVRLDTPGQLPHAFAERVRASMALTRQVALTDELGSVMLVGRRQPGSDGPITWQVEAVGRCDLHDPRVQRQVLDLVADVKTEFE